MLGIGATYGDGVVRRSVEIHEGQHMPLVEVEGPIEKKKKGLKDSIWL